MTGELGSHLAWQGLHNGWLMQARRIQICTEGFPENLIPLLGPTSWYCGYVGLPEGHGLIGMDAMDLPDLKVHGGVTFSASDWKEDFPDVPWWLGFDCAHCWDTKAFGGTPKPLQYVKDECVRLAQAIALWTSQNMSCNMENALDRYSSGNENGL